MPHTKRARPSPPVVVLHPDLTYDVVATKASEPQEYALEVEVRVPSFDGAAEANVDVTIRHMPGQSAEPSPEPVVQRPSMEAREQVEFCAPRRLRQHSTYYTRALGL